MRTDRRSQRVDALAQTLNSSGVLHLRDAAQLLGVSEMTVRRDLAGAPDRFGYLGGYIVTRSSEGPYSIAREQPAHEVAKAAVCARAASIIEDDDTIFIDCGTTTPHLLRHLRPDFHLTIVCYALNIASPLALVPNVRLILLGGVFNPSSASFAVEEGLAVLNRIGINKAFLSAGGVHAERGVSCSNFHEVAVKQAVLRSAVQCCLVVDGSKFGKVKPAFFAELDAFDMLVTDAGPQAERVRERFSGAFVAV